MNNLFQHSTKELTTDAFLTWLFFCFNNELKGKGAQFFHDLGLNILSTDNVSDISVHRQKKDTDLILECKVNGNSNTYLFENKTYSTIHSNQLKKYKKAFSFCKNHIYLKLGVINHEESTLAKSEGYSIIGVEKLYQALLPLRGSHFLVGHYIDFIKKEYVEQQEHILSDLISKNLFRVLNCSGKDKGQEQQFILSNLHETLDAGKQFKYLKFRYAANQGGCPWVQLTIASRSKAYGDKGESIFWRIDKRDSRRYLRLTQYSDIPETSKSLKHKNRDIFREKVKEVLLLPALDKLKQGKLQNKGTKASEILIFFFDENKLPDLVSELPFISKKLESLYHSTKFLV